ncbi:hypothetical protein IFM89_010951 [Coptis chinensis]|uniref:F-box domain-containing protein n=1 Tax=Coptis chinensis TaxID=261450 RepID=A0A835MDX5_9MAGN|nr:hypothetical protein IFM89_010951 [Coptis chinensis]
MEPCPSKRTRNWHNLPRDVLILIFMKLELSEVLYNAQLVCSWWRKIAKEPELFHIIDVQNLWDFFDIRDYDHTTKTAKDPGILRLNEARHYFETQDYNRMSKMAIEAINRSCGELVKFSIMKFATDKVLRYIGMKSGNSLKCLRLAKCKQVSEKILIQVVKKLPLLEEFELCYSSFSWKVIKVVGHSCPRLISFRLNRHEVKHIHYSPYRNEFIRKHVIERSLRKCEVDDDAFAIAANMPTLRRLHLFGNSMTDKGLRAILDKCPHLEYLDLRKCFYIKFGGFLRERCQGIRILRLPDDSTDDFDFDLEDEYVRELHNGINSDSYSSDPDELSDKEEEDDCFM